jgi:hypothetical protein
MYGDLGRHLAQARYDDVGRGVSIHRSETRLRDRMAARRRARALHRTPARGTTPEVAPAPAK